MDHLFELSYRSIETSDGADSLYTKIKDKHDGSQQQTSQQQINTSSRKRYSFLILFTIFSMAVIALYLTYRTFPKLDEWVRLVHVAVCICDQSFICSHFREEKQRVKLPMSLEDAKQLGRVLTKYRSDHYPQVLALVTLVYILYPFTSWSFMALAYIYVVPWADHPFADQLLVAHACSYVASKANSLTSSHLC